MTRRDFLQRCAALAGALALPAEVLALSRELQSPTFDVDWLPPQHWNCRSNTPSLWVDSLVVSAGDEAPGLATLRRGASNVLLRVWAGRGSFGRWRVPLGDALLWTPDLRLEVSAGAVAAVPFADRVLVASDTEQRWLSTVWLP